MHGVVCAFNSLCICLTNWLKKCKRIYSIFLATYSTFDIWTLGQIWVLVFNYFISFCLKFMFGITTTSMAGGEILSCVVKLVAFVCLLRLRPRLSRNNWCLPWTWKTGPDKQSFNVCFLLFYVASHYNSYPVFFFLFSLKADYGNQHEVVLILTRQSLIQIVHRVSFLYQPFIPSIKAHLMRMQLFYWHVETVHSGTISIREGSKN